MKRLSFVLVLLSMSLARTAAAGDCPLTIPVKTGKTSDAFIPPGWKLIQDVSGGLFGSGRHDHAMIVEQRVGTDGEPPEGALVLLKEEKSGPL